MSHQDTYSDGVFHLGLTEDNISHECHMGKMKNTLFFSEDNQKKTECNNDHGNIIINNNRCKSVQPLPGYKRKRDACERRRPHRNLPNNSSDCLHDNHHLNNNTTAAVNSTASICGRELSRSPGHSGNHNDHYLVSELMAAMIPDSSLHRIESDDNQQHVYGFSHPCLSNYYYNPQSIPSLSSARANSPPRKFLQNKQQLQSSSSTTSSTYSAKISANQFVVDAIRDKLRAMLKGTCLKPDTESIFLLNSNDVVPCTGNQLLLGTGAFAQVTRVTIRGDWNEKQQYACKQLKREILADSQTYTKAAAELAYEAHVLGSLDHPNIVKLRGLPAGGIASFGNAAAAAAAAACDEQQDHQASSKVLPPAASFFFMMDVLRETLDQRIKRWKTVNQPRNNIEVHLRKIEKISMCKQLACALDYIHSKGVVYRDLKPQNIGFCEHSGNLKLFDFGLCRELPLSTESSENHSKESNVSSSSRGGRRRLHLSGVVGTMRYMAPEVCLHQPYNRNCDIYSWSIVSWEILSQAKPFDTFTPDLYLKLVCKQGVRPTDLPLSSEGRRSPADGKYSDGVTPVPHELEVLLKEAWKCKPQHRIRLPMIQSQLDLFQNVEELWLAEERIKDAAVSSSYASSLSFTSNSGMWDIGTGAVGGPQALLMATPMYQPSGFNSTNCHYEDTQSQRKRLRSAYYQSDVPCLISLDSYGLMTQSKPSLSAARQSLAMNSMRSLTANTMDPVVDLLGSGIEQWLGNVEQ